MSNSENVRLEVNGSGYFSLSATRDSEDDDSSVPAFICMDKCADVNWDFVSAQLLLALAFWGGLVLIGLMFSFSAWAFNLDKLKSRVDIWRSKLQASLLYSGLIGCTSIAQCVLFALRSLTKSTDYVTFGVDALACFLFLGNLLVTWAHLYLTSAVSGFVYMGSWALIDCLMMPSVVSLAVVELHGSKTWFSFSFMSALHVLESWSWFLEIRQINLQVLRWQVTDVAVSVTVTVYFAAMMMMTLENLGDPSIFSSLNDEKWNFVAALYYVFITLATVGYGDLAPRTALGRLFSFFSIFGGMSVMLMALMKVIQVVALHSQGGGSFHPPRHTSHIVVTGDPSVQMIKDFIAELFHPDHAEDAEDLHLVFLLPRSSNAVGSIQKWLRMAQNLHVASRVHLRQGSVLEEADLFRVRPRTASAFFVLPNIQCEDLMHEDTENIIRMLAVLKVVPSARMILLLMRAEHEQLLHDTGVGTLSRNITCLSMDQFKLELVGKSCQVPGFATMLCNLFKTVSGEFDEDFDFNARGLSWLKDYDRGAENELYQVDLSDVYTANRYYFCDIVMDVLAKTDGKVYLIGLVEVGLGTGQKRVLVNPGTYYKVKSTAQGIHTCGVFIAADLSSIRQSEDDQVEFGRMTSILSVNRESRKGSKGSRRGSLSRQIGLDGGEEAIEFEPLDGEDGDAELSRQISGASKSSKRSTGSRASETSQARMDRIKELANYNPLDELIDKDVTLSKVQKKSAKTLMELAKKQQKALKPAPPPLDLLAKGGHILLLCLGAEGGDEFRLGAEHFLRPLRGEHALDCLPLVLMGPEPPKDWGNVSDEKAVFFLKGNPLSLFDLERACFRAAMVIFVCHVGGPSGQLHTEQWMVDSDVICCTRLIESTLPWGSSNVIVQLNVDMNHPFVALPKQRAAEAARSSASAMNIKRVAHSAALSQWHNSPEALEFDEGMDSDTLSGKRKRFRRLKANIGPRMENGLVYISTPWYMSERQLAEYYRQPRFACGQLFVGNVITSLVVNCYFNDSLWEVLHTMIASEVIMVPVKYSWEGKTYEQFFDHLLKEKHLMAVAIYRVAEGPREHPGKRASQVGGGAQNQPRRWCYVFTTPPCATKLLKGDSVICFGPMFQTSKAMEGALSRTTKIQAN